MATAIPDVELLEADEFVPDVEPARPRSSANQNRQRFTIAAVVGTAIAFPLFLWLQWDLWSGSLNPLRAVPYDNFYDLQARALFHGHFYLPNGKMGIEAFVHDGHDYTYFGLFPSLIRMPILLLTSRLDGQMTAPSILVAWLLTALFSALMLWRLRILMRGDSAVGRAEAVSFGALMATIMGGSVILYLAATPFVYSEDFAWSIPLTVGSLFALLGVLERPTKWRVIASGVLILCTNLDRSPPGWACSIAALADRRMVRTGSGRGVQPALGPPHVRRGHGPVPRQLCGHLRQVRHSRRPAHGRPGLGQCQRPPPVFPGRQRREGLQLRLPAEHPVGLFPTFRDPSQWTLPLRQPPGGPGPWLAGAVLDQSYPTASFTDTSPLLLLLGCWGVVTAFRPTGHRAGAADQDHPVRRRSRSRRGTAVGIHLAALPGDLMPFFIIASGIGLIDVWRRLEARPQARRVVAGRIVTIGAYCVAANLAIAAFPVAQWTMAQSAGSFPSEVTEHRLAGDTVRHGEPCPTGRRPEQLFAMNNCSGLYLSTGNT